MIKRNLDDCNPYSAPKHFDMKAIRIHGKEESGAEKFWMGMSHFLPGGGAEYDEAPTEKIYFVLEGEITIYSKDKEKIVLKKNESIFIGEKEGRTIVNDSNMPATMLVVINYP
ncbi:MAG: cupin domain-containing protein [Clostridiales bacterium]